MYTYNGQPVSLFMLPRETRASELVQVFGHQARIWSEGDRTFVLVARESACGDGTHGRTRADHNQVASRKESEVFMRIRWAIATLGVIALAALTVTTQMPWLTAKHPEMVEQPGCRRVEQLGADPFVSRRRQAGEPGLHAEGHHRHRTCRSRASRAR